MSEHNSEGERRIATGERNRALAVAMFRSSTSLCTPPPYEWAVTIAFYAAVHFIDAYFSKKNLGSPGDHQTRNRLVNTIGDLRYIAPAYNQLHSDSRIARYEPGRSFRSTEVQTVFADMQYVRAEIVKLIE